MDFFKFIPTLIIGFSIVCHTFPLDENEESGNEGLDNLIKNVSLDVEVSEKNGVDIGNQTSQNHRVPDDLSFSATNLGTGCRIEYETKYGIEEEETTRQDCQWTTENKCTTKTREKCTKYNDRVCDTKYRPKCRNWTEKECKDTWRNDCSTKTKEECNDNVRPIQVPYEEDECVTTKERRCEKHWEEPTKGRKVWVDNPATCKEYDVTDCRPITKYRTEQEKYTKCNQVPYEHCDRVKDTNCLDVPKQKCEDEEYEDCYDVSKQKCLPDSWEDCQDYPKQECQDVHLKIPKQVSKQVPIRVCGNRRDPYHRNLGDLIDGSSSFEVKSTDGNDIQNDSEIVGENQIDATDIGLIDQKVKDIVLENDRKKDNEHNGVETRSLVFGDK